MLSHKRIDTWNFSVSQSSHLEPTILKGVLQELMNYPPLTEYADREKRFFAHKGENLMKGYTSFKIPSYTMRASPVR